MKRAACPDAVKPGCPRCFFAIAGFAVAVEASVEYCSCSCVLRVYVVGNAWSASAEGSALAADDADELGCR